MTLVLSLAPIQAKRNPPEIKRDDMYTHLMLENLRCLEDIVNRCMNGNSPHGYIFYYARTWPRLKDTDALKKLEEVSR